MKFFVVALVLGCAAIVCKFAVQSNFFLFNNPGPIEAPDIKITLGRLGLDFSTVAQTVQQLAPAVVPVPEKPRKLKVEEALQLIEASAEKHKVPATFVRSIVAAESNYDSEAISRAGAIGLMQLMPETAEEYGADPTIPEQNVDAGTHYLRVLMDRYSKQRDPLRRVIAAYNAGPGNVDRYKGVPPFRETRTYVKRVLGYLHLFEGTPKNIPITLATLTD